MDSDISILTTTEGDETPFRLSAINQAVHQGSAEELLITLQACLQTETDDECRMLLANSIAKVRGRASFVSFGNETTQTTTFFQNFQPLSAPEKLGLLSTLTPDQIKAIGEAAIPEIEREENPGVKGSLIRTFAPTWTEEKIFSLAPYLESHLPSVKHAVVETWIQTNPALLTQYLPNLLTSEDFRTRAIAFRGLALIDMDEALEHLETFLISDDSKRKMAGLQNAFYFPFEKAKPLLFKFLANENDLDLIERAGLFFGANPDPEVPFHLFEMAENVSPKKARIFKSILSSACRALEKSGILGEDFPKFMERLKDSISWRAANRFVQDCIGRLDEEEKLNPEIAASIRGNLEKPYVKQLFQENLTGDHSDKIKEKIRIILGPPIAIEEKDIPEADPMNLGDEIPQDEKIRRIASWQPDQKEKVIPIIEDLFRRPETSEEILSTAIRSALRLEIGKFTDEAARMLELTDPNPVTAALEYLAKYDPDKIIPVLGKFTQSPNFRIKVAAIKFLEKCDPPQAVASVKALLNGKNPEQQSLALNCLIHFDFHLVRDLLTEFLSETSSQKLFLAGLALFQSNPAPENLYSLFQLERSLPHEFKQAVTSVRVKTAKSLKEIGILSEKKIKEIEDSFEKKYTQEQTKKSAPPPYSVRAIQAKEAANKASSGKKDKGKEMSFQAILEDINKNLGKPFWIGVAALGFAAVFLAVIFFRGDDVSEGKAVAGNPFTMIGTVSKVLVKSEEIILTNKDGSRFQLPLLPNSTPPPEGARVRAVIVPHYIEKDGTVLARFISMKEY